MAIEYVKVKRNILLGDNPGERYVARLFRGQDMDLDMIAESISNSTTLSYADVLAVLKSLELEISRNVLNGSAVKLGYLGSFIPSTSPILFVKRMQCVSVTIAGSPNTSPIIRFALFLPTPGSARSSSKDANSLVASSNIKAK